MFKAMSLSSCLHRDGPYEYKGNSLSGTTCPNSASHLHMDGSQHSEFFLPKLEAVVFLRSRDDYSIEEL